MILWSYYFLHLTRYLYWKKNSQRATNYIRRTGNVFFYILPFLVHDYWSSALDVYSRRLLAYCWLGWQRVINEHFRKKNTFLTGTSCIRIPFSAGEYTENNRTTASLQVSVFRKSKLSDMEDITFTKWLFGIFLVVGCH